MKLLSTTALMRCFLALSFVSVASCAQAQSDKVSDLSKAQVEKIVKDYLLENPEIVRDALIELQVRQELGAEQETKDVIASMADPIYKDPRDASIGPDDAKVTIVEFFDYNCGFCKRSTQWLKIAIDEHPKDLRVVFKELPVLEHKTQTSRNAAKAALAARRQGKYKEMHFALMEGRGLTAERVRDMAEEAGLDMAKFDKDMLVADFDRHIDDNLDLAARIPALTGTPFFVIGDDYVSGANTEALDDMLKAALKS